MNKLIVSLLLTLFIGACQQSYQDIAKARRQRAKEAHRTGGDIVIGVVWPRGHSGHFLEGIDLAVNEINRCGGVKSNCCQCQQAKSYCQACQQHDIDCETKCQALSSACQDCQQHPYGRKIRIIQRDEEPPVFSPRIRNAPQRFANQVAVELAKNLDVIAVIGHPPSAEAIPASIVYQYYRVLFLAPASTNLALTNPGFPLVFRLIPNNQHMAEQLAGYCALYKHYHNIVILNVRTAYGEELADSFNDSAARMGINVVHRGSFFADMESFDRVVAGFKEKQFDAVFIAAGDKEGYRLIQQMVTMGMTQPIIGGDALYSEKFTHFAGKISVTVPVVYKETFNFAKPFIAKYREVFKQDPDHWAAQGYDSIKLLAYIIEQSDSSVPPVLATTLRYLSMWIGVTGVHAFEEDGEIQGKQFSFKELENSGQWVTIPGAHIPYLLHNLEQRHHLNQQE